MDPLLDFFKALSDETRLRLIMLLHEEDLCVCEMCGVLDLSQPKVSKHLAKLRDKGFVSDQRREQFIFYSLNIEDPVLSKLLDEISGQLDRFPQLKHDRKRLSSKATYLNQCNVTGLKILD